MISFYAITVVHNLVKFLEPTIYSVTIAVPHKVPPTGKNDPELDKSGKKFYYGPVF